MNTLVRIFKTPDLRRRFLFMVICLIIYRIGAHITVPGVDPVKLSLMIENFNGKAIGRIFSYIDLFAGGAFTKFTIFALGIMPYITSSIIMQLLTVVLPSLEQLKKEGEYGRQKMQQYTRYLTIFICIVQSTAITRWMISGQDIISSQFRDNTTYFMVLAVVTITSGTLFLMWLGEQISERGIGNGISLIIFSGIAARIPGAFIENWSKVRLGDLNPVIFVLLLVVFATVIFFVVYEQQGQRRIPVQYAKRVVGRKMYGAQSTYLPFKINPTGVIPIIFASAVILLPSQLIQMLGDSYPNVTKVAVALSPGQVPYMVFYGLLVILFSYIYTTVQFNPVEISDMLRKNGGYIPGIRPGLNTQEYLQKILIRLTSGGSIFLVIVAIFPDILLKINLFSDISPSFAYLMGGTSLLILVSVDLDTMRQIEAQLVNRNYDGFLTAKKRRKQGR